MGKAKREHREAVVAGTSLPIRHDRPWRPTPTLFKAPGMKSRKASAVTEEDEVWKQKKEVAKDVSTDS